MSQVASAGGRASFGAWLDDLVSTGPGLIAARILVALAIVAAWEFLPPASVRFWISSPSAIFSLTWTWMIDGTLWGHLGATLTVMSIGYVLGCLIGIGLGLALGLFPRVYEVVGPFLAAFYALPKIALAPLFIIMLGIGMESKIALVTLTVFFLLLNNTLNGVKNVDQDLVEALKLMGADQSEVVRKALLPATLAWIFTGMRIAVRYAFTNTMLAELISANMGLGFLLSYYSGRFDATGAFAAVLILVVFSVVMSEILMATERKMARWRT